MSSLDKCHPRGSDYPGMSKLLLGGKPSADMLIRDRQVGKKLQVHRVCCTRLDDYWQTWFHTSCGERGLLENKLVRDGHAGAEIIVCPDCDTPK